MSFLVTGSSVTTAEAVWLNVYSDGKTEANESWSVVVDVEYASVATTFALNCPAGIVNVDAMSYSVPLVALPPKAKVATVSTREMDARVTVYSTVDDEDAVAGPVRESSVGSALTRHVAAEIGFRAPVVEVDWTITVPAGYAIAADPAGGMGILVAGEDVAMDKMDITKLSWTV